MKGNKKVLIVAILLLLIAVSYSTYAIYKTNVEGTGTVTAATWNVQFKDGNTVLQDTFTVTFGATDCVNNAHVADGVIAPGATCTKDITLLATGTQVDVTYDVSVDGDVTATKSGQPVATTNANDFEATLTATNGSALDGVILMTDNPMSETIRVTLTWDGEEDATTTDPADTALNGATFSVPLTLVAKQTVTQAP